MNVLIFDAENAQALRDKQSGTHRLMPVPLNDGRGFLTDDVLDSELHPASILDGITYTTAAYDTISAYIITIEE